MFAMVLNWKGYSSGSLVGFFDLSVCGLVVTGCRAFKKDDRVWFSWPSERVPDKNGGDDKWRDIVTAAEPTMKHLQGIVRPQIRTLLESDQAPQQRSAHPAPGTRQGLRRFSLRAHRQGISGKPTRGSGRRGHSILRRHGRRRATTMRFKIEDMPRVTREPDESFERMCSRFTRKCLAARVLKEQKERRAYRKPSEERRLQRVRARRRARREA